MHADSMSLSRESLSRGESSNRSAWKAGVVRFSVLALLIVACVGGASADGLRDFDGFEDGDYTNSPSWNKQGSGQVIVQQSQKISGSYALEIDTSSSDSSSGIEYERTNGGGISAGDTYQISFYADDQRGLVYGFGNTQGFNYGTSNSVYLYAGRDDVGLNSFDPNGDYTGGNSYTYNADEWYTAKLTFYPSQDKIEFLLFDDTDSQVYSTNFTDSSQDFSSFQYVKVYHRVQNDAFRSFVDDVSYSTKPPNDAPEFNSTNVDPDPPLIGENVSYSAEVFDSDGSISYTNLSLSYGGSTVVVDEQRTGTSPVWNDIFTPQTGNKWLNATLEVVDDAGAVTTTEINRFLGDSNPGANINSPSGTVFDYDQSINVDTEDDGDSNPDEQLSCSLDLDGNQIDQRTVTEGDSYTVTTRADLGNHSASVTCTEQDDQKQDTGNTTFTVQDFEIQSVSSASQVFETEERSFSLSYRSGDMIQNQDAELSLNYDGETDVKSFSLQPSQDQTESIKRNIPLVNQNQTVKNFDLSVNYQYDNFNGQTETETVSGSDFSSNNTKEEGNFYNVEVVSTSDGNKYVLNGTRRKEIDLERGVNHTFNLTSSVQGHPFHISTSAIGGNFNGQITEGVSVTDPYNGNEHAADTGKLFYKPPETESRDLYYQCGVHQYMGADITLLEALTFSNNQTVLQSYFIEGSSTPPRNGDYIETENLQHVLKVHTQTKKADLTGTTTYERNQETSQMQETTVAQDLNQFKAEIDTGLADNFNKSKFNVSSDITVNFEGDTRTLEARDEIEVYRIQITDGSTSLDTEKTLNFDIDSEETGNSVKANFQADFSVWKDRDRKIRRFNFQKPAKKEHEFFIYPSWAEYNLRTLNYPNQQKFDLIQFFNEDTNKVKRSYFFPQVQKINNDTTTVPLKTINRSETRLIDFEMSNSEGDPAENVYCRVDRKFAGGNFQTSFVFNTNSEGKAEAAAETTGTFYGLKCFKDGDLIETFSAQKLQDPVRLQFGAATETTRLNFFEKFDSACTTGTTFVNCSYQSQSEKLEKAVLDVERQEIVQDVNVCTETGSTATGRLVCTGLNTSKEKYKFDVQAQYPDTTTQGTVGVTGTKEASIPFSGLFMTAIIFMLVTSASAYNITIGIGAGTLTMLLMSIIDFITLTPGQRATLIAVAIIAGVAIQR